MDKETKRKMISFLDQKMREAAEDNNVVVAASAGNIEKWGRSTLHYLRDLGALREVEHGWVITAHASEVRGRLFHPRVVWLRENWFPVGILLITALVGVGTIVSNVFSRGGV